MPCVVAWDIFLDMNVCQGKSADDDFGTTLATLVCFLFQTKSFLGEEGLRWLWRCHESMDGFEIFPDNWCVLLSQAYIYLRYVSSTTKNEHHTLCSCHMVPKYPWSLSITSSVECMILTVQRWNFHNKRRSKSESTLLLLFSFHLQQRAFPLPALHLTHRHDDCVFGNKIGTQIPYNCSRNST